MNLPRAWVCAGLWIFSGALTTAQTKKLHWQSLDVRAHLDANGALHVQETQAMVFNGDWNDGPRLKFERLLDSSGAGGGWWGLVIKEYS